MAGETFDPALSVLIVIDDDATAQQCTEAVRSANPLVRIAQRIPDDGSVVPDVIIAHFEVDLAKLPGGVPVIALAPAGTALAALKPMLDHAVHVLLQVPGYLDQLPLAVMNAARHARTPGGAAESHRAASLADTLRLIQAENDRLTALVARLEDLAITDPLTGLLNRRGFLARLEELHAAAARHATPFSVLALDLDGLKCVNDALGHAAGDELLRAAAAVLTRASRRSDVAGRLGGDEFALILPHTGAEGAADVAARIRTMFAEAATDIAARLRAKVPNNRLKDRGGPGLSVGAATIELARPIAETCEALLGRADDALYRAKSSPDSRPVQAPLGA